MLRYFFVFFFIFFYTSFSNANEKIAFIDIDKIINGSNLGKKLNIELDKKIKKENDLLIAEEKKLKDKEIEILNQKNILSEDELNKKISKLRDEINNYRNKKLKIDNEFRDIKLKQTNSLVSSLNAILSNYAEKNSISLIVQKKYIVVGKTELDITNNILKIFNEEVKSINQ